MRAAASVLALALLACGGEDYPGGDPTGRDCAPIGLYTCSCTQFVNSCTGKDLLGGKHTEYVTGATELCGAARRETDTGWISTDPTKPAASCQFRVWEDMSWGGVVTGQLLKLRHAKVACPGAIPCEVDASCHCEVTP